MRTSSVFFAALMLLAACSKEEPVYGVGGQEPQFGDYSRSEIDAVRSSISDLSFPVPEHTISKLLPKPLEPLPVQFGDWLPDAEKKGRVGGMIVEYWLSHDFVLKVATAYYSKDDRHFSMEEWAVVLPRSERDTFSPPIY